MIWIFLKTNYKIWWFVTLPHEINNEFLFNLDQYTKKNPTSWWYLEVWASDFGSIEFPPDKLDKLYHDFDILEKHLDEIIKIVPLPKVIGWWEWYHKGFVSFYKEGVDEVRKYLPQIREDEIQDIVNCENMIQQPVPFLESDLLLIISLIKKKILEAKEKNETLVFSGD